MKSIFLDAAPAPSAIPVPIQWGPRAPIREPRWFSPRDGAPLEAWVASPRRDRSPRGTWIAVHGISRDADEQLQAWEDFADEQDLALVVPCFSKDAHPTYQRLGAGAGPGAPGADESLLRLLTWLELEGVVLPRPRYLFGHSGGAQFAHRFALRHPGEVHGLFVSAAGWYTYPDPDRAFPLGIREGGAGTGSTRARLRAWLSIPTLVTVGERDVERDPSLRLDATLDHEQGPNRVARAHRWASAFRNQADRLGFAHRCECRALPGAGHAFQQCVEAGLLREARRFLADLAPGA